MSTLSTPGLVPHLPTGLNRFIPLSTIILWQILTLVFVLASWALGLPWYVPVLLSIILSGLLFIRLHGTTIGSRWATRLKFWGRKIRKAENIRSINAIDVAIPDGGSFGLRWDGNTIITMLEVRPRPRALTFFEPGAIITDDLLPLDTIAKCLDQFDISLESIDIICHGSRAYGAGPIAQIYDRILGPLPATARRSIYILLRMNPLNVADATLRRGGDTSGTIRTAVVATRRVANKLAEQGHDVTIASAAEFISSTSQLTENSNPRYLEEQWDTLQSNSLHFTSFEIEAESLTPQGLSSLWTLSALSTTITIRIRPLVESFSAAEKTQLDEGPHFPTKFAISAIARVNSTHPVTSLELPGMRRLVGNQLRSTTALLPIPHAPLSADQPIASEFITTLPYLKYLSLPSLAAGQLIGADNFDRAVTLTLVGPQVRNVDIVGSVHLAQQVALRAIATGARILIHTNRPWLWKPMVDRVADANTLWIAATGQIQAGSTQGYTALLYDGVAAESMSAQVTIIRLYDTNQYTPTNADVILTQSHSSSEVAITTSEATTTAHIVATQEELYYIGHTLEH